MDRSKDIKFASEVPRVGDAVYIPSEAYLSHGADDMEGGLTTIIEVGGSEGNHWVKTAFDPVAQYTWCFLYEKQEQLAKAFGDRPPRQTPDYRPEFNEGWETSK